jgi:hypothetical protein
MSDGRAESSEPPRHDCTQECAQEHYDWAAWDYVNWLNELSQKERDRYFANSKWLDLYFKHPKPSTRCTKCGEVVIERKWSKTHIDWQCLEPTCREFWEWRAK